MEINDLIKSEQKPKKIDRLRTLAYAACPRMRYYQYHWGGLGIVPSEVPAPLAIGLAFHEGARVLLDGLRVGAVPDEEAAVAVAVKCLTDVYAGCERTTLSPTLQQEQPLLVEAMVRLYARYGVRLLQDQYEVLEVEQETEVPLMDNLIWMSRADGLLRSKEDGQLYVLSFKTAKAWSSRHQQDGNFDMQGLSEAWALQQRFIRWSTLIDTGQATKESPSPWFQELYADVGLPLIAGTQMIYAVKGETKIHKQQGIEFHNTPLLWPWFKQGRYAHSYFFCDPSTGANRALGSTWTQVPIYEKMSIKEWIFMLVDDIIQPEAGNICESLIFQPEPYIRQQEHMERWARQTALREGFLAMVLSELEINTDEQRAENLLDAVFWHNTKSCVWPSRCSYIPICHYGADPADMVLSGSFVERTPHHEGELKSDISGD